MKTQIYLIIVSLLSFVSCQNSGDSSNVSLPLINSVQDLDSKEASSIPFLDETYMVRGKVVGIFFIFGKGCLRVADLNDPKVVVSILSKQSRRIGQVATFKVVKKDIVQIDDNTMEVFVEQ